MIALPRILPRLSADGMAPVLRSLMQGRGFNFVRAVAASGLLRPLTMGPRLRSVGFVKSSTQNPTVFSRAHVAFAVRSGGHVRWLSAAGEKEEVKAKEGEKDGKAEEAPEGAEAKKAEEGQTGEAKEGKPEASEAEVLESRIQELELQVKRKDEDINELKKR